MYKFKSLHCYHCKSVILNLPDFEISKLDGLSFQCECCGHTNVLSGSKFSKGSDNDPLLNTFSFDALYQF
ncbi:MAG: hypothetical protein N2489_06335 [Clostridia bacterium]|nr:hypothetical protein [Clostridia bacterium]